jgi:hypothetical protein
MRVGLGAVGALVCVFAVLIVLSIGHFTGDVAGDGDKSALLEKIQGLEGQLREKDLALAVQEKRLKEKPLAQALASAAPLSERQDEQPTEEPESEPKDAGPLTSVAESDVSDATGGPTGRLSAEAVSPPPSGGLDSRDAEGSEPPVGLHPDPNSELPGSGAVQFNAKELTAVSENSNSGKLSFLLFKDTPGIRFSGYLFVFVEMADNTGENKIYVYPQRTRLGEGDLPTDYREGQNITFKRNSRVELPYKDGRQGAALNRVSIVLYGEDGNIVFQRAFEGTDVSKVSKASTNADDIGSHRTGRRRAL